jgi:hypothetical protein
MQPQQPQQPQQKTGLPELPRDEHGNLDPTGGFDRVPEGRISALDTRVVHYGQAGALFDEKKDAMNPLASAPVRAVFNEARKRMNEHLRFTGKQVLGQDEDVPNLLALIELMEYTQEPLRTDAMKGMRHLQVELCTSREIVVKWGRTPYKAVPYEVRSFPLHVAHALLQQIKSFLYVPVVNEQRGVFVGRRVPRSDSIQVSHKPFRAAKDGEIRPDRLKQLGRGNLTAVGGKQGSTGELLVNLEPETGDDPLNVAGGQIREIEQDGATRQTYVTAPNTPATHHGVAPAQSTSQAQEAPQEQPAGGFPPPPPADGGAR